jgi:TolB-like protein
VQLTIDGAPLPMPFDRIQCADMTGWNGDFEAPGWRKVAASLAELMGGAPGTANHDALPLLPSKPSIAVAPFVSLGAGAEQDYFAEGMVEEIVSALARFKSIFVVSAGANRVFMGKVASPQEAARQLGVRYLLEGSVRRAGDRVRIVVHLIDASNGVELWTDRLDDSSGDIFALQDRVASRVAGVMETTLQDLAVEKASRRPTDNTGSYDFYLRALGLFKAFRKADMLQAIALLDRAIELDPDFALALSHSAVCHRQVVEHGWADNVEPYRLRGLELVERALRSAGDDAKVLAQAAASLPGLEGHIDRAITLIERAIEVNPGSSFVWLISGSLQIRNGRPDIAGEHLETSIRLDPISEMSGLARMYLASARFQEGRFEEALELFRSTIFRLPVSYAVLAALHGHLGQIGPAREALEQFRSSSTGTAEEFADIWFPHPEQRKLFLDGLALAAISRP